MPRIEVKPAFAALIALLMLTGMVISPVAIAYQQWSGSSLGYAGVFTLAMLGIALCHEAGHVLAGLALGLRWTLLRFTLGVGVGLSSRSNGEQIVVSLAGPAVHLIVCLLLLMGHWPDKLGHPIAVAALMGVGDAVLNVLIVHPRLDGGRALRAAWQCLKGRTAERFASGPEEDEQAPVETSERSVP